MAAKQSSHRSHNRILEWLPEADRALVDQFLEPVSYLIRQKLEERDRKTSFIYFPTSGMASVIVRGPEGRDIEAGIIGSDGMTGLAAVLGADRPLSDTIVQISGEGHRISLEAFTELLRRSEAFDRACRRYVHAFLIQVSYTALANGRNNIEERLARWLLIAQDRAGGAELAFTHEFLALMLGVRRAGVTLAIKLLADAGLISRARGTIAIADRPGLIAITKGSYGPAEAYYDRLFEKKRAESAV